MIKEESIVSVALHASAMVHGESRQHLTSKDYEISIVEGVGIKFTHRSRRVIRHQKDSFIPSTIVTFAGVKSIVINQEIHDGPQSKTPVANEGAPAEQHKVVRKKQSAKKSKD